jgi:hypothetical protein
MARWLLLLALVACSKASEQSDRLQRQAPDLMVSMPSGLSIDVTVDGAAKPPITTDTLKAAKPDFEDSERRAWKVATLVPEAQPGTVVEASAPTGVSVKLAEPTPDGLEPVLFLTRRGEVIVAAVDPKDPFPKFHGQGGRLHRAGDTMPRVSPVARLAITHATP